MAVFFLPEVPMMISYTLTELLFAPVTTSKGFPFELCSAGT